MTPYELIRSKRDGGVLAPADIRDFLERFTRGDVPDAQMAALCMAVWFRGLTPGELRAWTETMLRSGATLDVAGLGPAVDKHSTGGVGDKVSLCLAPLVAACGAVVPMISGRGLGHTGGTLDKLAAIPGFRTDLDRARARAMLEELGLVMLGQTDDVAPTDRKLYALRDVTATVDSIPLIAASILSKKLAEGLAGLVLDVKVGSGAFMKRPEDAERLARTLVDLAGDLGCRAVAWLTSMDVPLGRAVGNASELLEAVDVLRGGGPDDLVQITLRLGAEMLVLAGRARDVPDGETRLREAIRDGRGLARLRALVRAQGGDADALDVPARLGLAGEATDVVAARAGVVQAMDVEALGLAAVVLGAGRRVAIDAVDPGVGFTVLARTGDVVASGQPLVRVHHRRRQATLDEVLARVRAAVPVADAPAVAPPLFRSRIEAGP